jgi:DNA-binding transcriptional LysR family regulator
VAAPAYLQVRGRADHPGRLDAHEFLIYTNMRSPNILRFQHAELGEHTVTVRGHLAANNGEVFLPALRAGLGMAILPEFMVWRDLAEGRLEEVLPGWRLPPVDISLVTPPASRRPASVTVLLDYLTNRIKAERWARTESR